MTAPHFLSFMLFFIVFRIAMRHLSCGWNPSISVFYIIYLLAFY